MKNSAGSAGVLNRQGTALSKEFPLGIFGDKSTITVTVSHQLNEEGGIGFKTVYRRMLGIQWNWFSVEQQNNSAFVQMLQSAIQHLDEHEPKQEQLAS